MKKPLSLKRAACVLLLALCVGVGTQAQSQRVTLKLTQATLKQVFQTIEKQTSYRFSYRDAVVSNSADVTIDKKNAEVTDVLRSILPSRQLGFDIISDKSIVIYDLTKKATSGSKSKKKITGIVTDEKGEPIIGASVKVKGSNIGVITDLSGRYTLEVPSNQSVLEVSYVGYKSQNLSVGNQEQINFRMHEDKQLLDEVVVVGYGTQKKANLTGAVASLSSADLAGKPVTSTAQALAGLVPGLSVLQNSGRPGAGADVKIRGTGTFSSAGNDPLVLIDGLAGSIDDVDPGDVESISFLKDAASASIYGNRAANGVILVETKKGSKGKTQITYNNSFGWQSATELPEFLPSWEYAQYYNIAMSNMGRQNAYTQEQIEKFRNGTDPDNYPNVNHLKWLLNTGDGFQHQHNINVNGGNEKVTYNVSVGYRSQNGMTEKTNNSRMTALVALSAEIANNLTFIFNANAYNNKYKAPNGEPQSIEGIIGYAVREGPVYAGIKSDGSFGYQDNYSPEAWLNSESFVENISRNVSASGKLKWLSPLEGLTFNGRVGVTYYTEWNKAYRANTYFDDSKSVGPAQLTEESANNTYTTIDVTADYANTFGLHDVHALLGMSVERSINRGLNGYRNTFPNNYLYELVSGDVSTATNSSNLTDYALLSYFGRINYAFNERYLIEANLRIDGSSRFASDHRWGVFPSVSTGWRISEESFWKNYSINNVVNYLKMRLSYGVLGNQNIGVYPYQQTYSLGYDAALGNPATVQSGAYIATYKNQDITWEKTAIVDFGLDFSIWNNTLSGTIDYFYKYTSDILSAVEVSSIMGRSVGQSNVGAVSNQGVEVNLTYNWKVGGFHFCISPNFTYVKNAVEELSNGTKEEINNNRIVGQPLGIIYGYKTNGLFVDQTEIDAAPDQLVDKSSIKPGYVRYEDISGPNGVPDGKVDAEYDRTVLGSTTPRFYYGLNITMQYKNIDFSALFQGLGGHKRLIGSYMAYAFYNGGQIQRWQAENAWTVENPNKWAEYPRLETLNMNDPNLQTSDYWVRDASFLRFKNMQVGYTFPIELTRKLGFNRIRVYFSAQNLFCINSFYKGWDPENEIGTGDAPSYYPINRILSFGFNFTF